jgi:hypothetical protein
VAELQAKWIPRWASRVVERFGWRIVTVALIAVLMIAITVVLFVAGVPVRSEAFWSEVFAAWMGGVFLFIVSGVAVTIVSIVPPETASFEARARILFRAAKGGHVDYIIERIKRTLEQYSHETRRTVTVRDYDAKEGKYLIEVSVVAVMRSYIQDAPSAAVTPLKIYRATPSPAGRAPANVMVRSNDLALIQSTEFEEQFDGQYVVRIPPDAEAKVETIINYWVRQNDEACTNNPVRFIRTFELVVDNQLPRNLRVKLSVQQDQAREVVIRAGSTTSLVNLSEVTPDQELFDLRLLEPEH